MKEYEISWTINVEEESAEEAAKKVWEEFFNFPKSQPDSYDPCVFQVKSMSREFSGTKDIDLSSSECKHLWG